MKKVIVIIFLFMPVIGNSQNFRIPKIENFIKQQNYKQAFEYLDSLEKHLDIDKKVIYKYYKALLYNKLKEFIKSNNYCSTAIQEHTDKDSLLIKLYGIRMNNYFELKNFNLAIHDNNILIDLAPKYIPFYLNLSFLYGLINNRKTSIAILEKALTIEPDNSYVYTNLAYSSSLLGNYENAIKFANKGLAHTKDSILIGCLLNNRGFARLNLKQCDDALKDINESIDKYQTNSLAYYYKVLVYIQLGENDSICKNLELAKIYGKINVSEGLIEEYNKLIQEYCKK